MAAPLTDEPSRPAQFAESLRPSVEEAVRISVHQDPRVLADALYPAIGPAIRQAVVSALSDMVQALSRVLDNALSLRGLRWRWEAFRTGRPVSEIAYYHSLLYSVEQVLLVHRHTGLLLHQVTLDSIVPRDNELIAGMLTAIQDFVKDSFQIDHGSALSALRIGEFSVWVELGPQALLAAVIRGQPRPELRQALDQVLEQIHRNMARQLLDFRGDRQPFEACDVPLRQCLTSELAAGEKPSRIPLLVCAAIVALLCTAWAAISADSRNRWDNFISAVGSRPGIVVTHAERGWRHSSVAGLRDPLSEDPLTAMRSAQIDPASVSWSWKPFLSLEPAIVLKRARNALAPPDTVTLRLAGDVLQVGGDAPFAWVVRTRRMAPQLPGVREIRFDGGWPEMMDRIERQRLTFALGSSQIDPAQEPVLDRLAEWIRAGFATAPLLVEITGHADRIGREERNGALSLSRARSVMHALTGRGVRASQLEAAGAGAGEPGRTVSFRVIVPDERAGEADGRP